MKTIKFDEKLVPLVLSGYKTVTFRLFDDKDIKQGDECIFINKQTGESFGNATIINVYEKQLKDLNEQDYEGHEKFESEEEMYKMYKKYYGDKVNKDTIVKIIKFDIIK
jgi:hypothetical protein